MDTHPLRNNPDDRGRRTPREFEGVWKGAFRRFTGHRLSLLGTAGILLILLTGVLAPAITPYEPNRTDVLNRLQPPSATHWMGTDELGRDLFTRILYGSRISLSVGVASMAISMVLGTLIGSIAGYFGGIFDHLLMRFTDVMISFPRVFVLILLLGLLGHELSTVIIVTGILAWMPMARLVRAEILALKEREFVLAARVAGASPSRIVTHHLLPNASSSIIVAASLGVADAVRTESGLSYLGLGLQPPTASWGTMLRNAQDQLIPAPWTAIFPGLMIFLTVMFINFIGDGLRDALDPRHIRSR
jgi:peptide/nickel transport system permease protein